jgi:hypothetical protein
VAEVASLRLATGQQHVRVTFGGYGGDVRVVDMHTFGQVAFTLIGNRAGAELADELTAAQRANADLVEFGAVRQMQPLTTSTLFLPEGGRWLWNRHLWASRVFDVHGIQLLTGRHLAHAEDLSGWLVEKVASDRWLVSARDLGPWYDTVDVVAWQRQQSPTPEHLAAARRDFGAMILTDEIAAAHPR